MKYLVVTLSTKQTQNKVDSIAEGFICEAVSKEEAIGKGIVAAEKSYPKYANTVSVKLLDELMKGMV